ncbi:hypothetical protein GCM10010319_68540 [Streptomyces blastmyceticus]|uniref:Secreted protein n=1 Tax=Streptomyces blastmyceticus TaxID=68180 RepID=A0ABN0Y1W6_9ACTN
MTAAAATRVAAVVFFNLAVSVDMADLLKSESVKVRKRARRTAARAVKVQRSRVGWRGYQPVPIRARSARPPPPLPG